MVFVTATEVKSEFGKVRAALAAQQDVVLTSHGKPFAMLCAVDEDSLEYFLEHIRRARALQAIARCHEAARRAGTATMTMREINAEIRRARRERRARATND